MIDTLPKLLTIRQFLFLNWLYLRKVKKKFCNIENIDISCHKCLNKKNECKDGVIPASFFYKKVNRQYFDCKRVLDSLIEMEFITAITINGKIFQKFYKITEKGIKFHKTFEKFYWVNDN